jgi:hypothetical protein
MMVSPVSCWFTAETDRETLAEAVTQWIVSKASDGNGQATYSRIDEERDAFIAAITRYTESVALAKAKGGA